EPPRPAVRRGAVGRVEVGPRRCGPRARLALRLHGRHGRPGPARARPPAHRLRGGRLTVAISAAPATAATTTASPRAQLRPAVRRRRRRNALWVALFLAPSAIPLLLFTATLMASSLWVSLHKWNLLAPMQWVGLDNYTKLLTDPGTRRIFGHTLLYIVGYLPPVYVGGLALALALNQSFKGRRFFPAAYFLPVVTSWVVVALVWQWLLNPNNGLVNTVLGAIG